MASQLFRHYLWFIFLLVVGLFLGSSCQIDSEGIKQQYLTTHSSKSKPSYQHSSKKSVVFGHGKPSTAGKKHEADPKSSMQRKEYGKKSAGTSDRASWLCQAMGSYEDCEMDSGFCWQRNVMGAGVGETRDIAAIKARMNCSDHLTSMIIIANMGGGGHLTMPCEVVSCSNQ